MGKLPKEVLQPASPFTTVALDLFGPLVTKGLGGHARKTFKTWGVLFVCVASKAVSLWLAPSYSAEGFMLCFNKQSAIYGRPASVLSDKGSQLVSAGKEVQEWEKWGSQVQATGTTWQYTPTACPWRNGQAERCVGLAKHTLSHLVNKHQLLNFAELEAVLLRVAEIINRRPLAIRDYSEADFHAVCPGDLLLGRIYGYQPAVPEEILGEDDQIKMLVRLAKVETLVKVWWQRWSSTGFPLMCPRRKWTQVHRNVAVGDVVLLRPNQQVGKGVYRLARVLRTMPDSDHVVRTVVIGMRRRRGTGREAAHTCKAGLDEQPMAVQRLVVIQPAGETWEGDLSSTPSH